MELMTLLLILVGLVIGWTVLKVVLRLTMRIFGCGCFALLVIFGVAFLLRQYM
jgi:hypothetical protein